jgi:hypothetical protein
VARLTKAYHILRAAREDATALVENDPHLERPEHLFLRREVRERYGESLGWLFQA